MTQKFTAEEVRACLAEFSSDVAFPREEIDIEKVRTMLTAYADALSQPADSGRVTSYMMEKLADAAAALDKLGRRNQCVHLMDLHAALAAQGQGDVPEGMQPSRPKPHMPIGMLGPEDFCFCGNEVSLQSVSGGGSPEGYLGSVRLKIGGRFVSYIRSDIAPPLYKASPAGVPDGWVLVPLELTREMSEAFFRTHGEVAWLDKGWAAALAAAPSAPEGDGGAE